MNSASPLIIMIFHLSFVFGFARITGHELRKKDNRRSKRRADAVRYQSGCCCHDNRCFVNRVVCLLAKGHKQGDAEYAVISIGGSRIVIVLLTRHFRHRGGIRHRHFKTAGTIGRRCIQEEDASGELQ